MKHDRKKIWKGNPVNIFERVENCPFFFSLSRSFFRLVLFFSFSFDLQNPFHSIAFRQGRERKKSENTNRDRKIQERKMREKRDGRI